MSELIHVQWVCQTPNPFDEARFITFAKKALDSAHTQGELSLRCVDVEEMTELNSTYRHKTGPTNVLSFPAELPDYIAQDYPLLGDIIICPAVLEKESIEQHKALEWHYAHIIIHGVLHLLGYDHIEEMDAQIMEAKEIQLLAELGFDNPYKEGELEQ